MRERGGEIAPRTAKRGVGCHVLRATFQVSPLPTVQLLLHPAGEWGLNVDAATNKFFDEFKLRTWIIEQNVLKGLAPPSSEVGLVNDVINTIN